MIDVLALIIGFFLICVIILIILLGVKILFSIVTAGQSNNSYDEETDGQLTEVSREDSQGDGLVLFDDPLFPEEFDDE